MTREPSRKPLRVGLFAAREVGRLVAGVFAGHGVAPVCVGLDEGDEAPVREAIVARSGVASPEAVFRSDELATPAGRERLSALRPDLVLLAWWPRIVKPPLLELPRLGFLNLHPSLLPENRGKDYNFWNLVEGAPYGVTIHWVDAGVDSGDIAFQAPLETSWEDTGETLYHRAQDALVALLDRHLDAIVQGAIPRRPQGVPRGPTHRRSELDRASRIRLDEPCTPRSLLNLLRARTFPPHPGVRFEDGGRTWEARIQIRRVDA
jgi:methionyl-tRNA formyltransferase